MKRFTLAIVFASLLLAGCKDESIDFGGGGNGETEIGYLSLSALEVDVANYAEEITSGTGAGGAQSSRAAGATSDAPGDYKVKIRSVKSGEESVYTYADLKLAGNQKLPLAPGAYVVSAESPDHADYMAGTSCADWERPVYFGSVTKNVIKRTETQVNDLVCTLANIKTTVTLTQDLQELFMSDAEAEAAGKEKLTVTLSVGDNRLVFDRAAADAGKAGYFKAVEASNTVKVVLSGQYNKAAADEAPEYVAVNWTKEITGCKAGQWRKVSIGVLNADEGNVQFQVTVENWVYDQKVEVDVTQLYAFGEETIPDDDVSDADSPVVTLDGYDIANGYDINGSMYDDALGKWNENLKAVFTPAEGASLYSVEMVFGSDNAAFLEALDAAGIRDRTVTLWPENEELAAYAVVRAAETGVVTVAVKDAGMSALYGFEGTHTVKFVAADDRGRTSYTVLAIRVRAGGAVAEGPSVVWTDKAGTKHYDFGTRYNHNAVEIVIDVTTQSAFTGFTVDIVSESVLPPSELTGVGLTAHLDLINPGQYKAQLEGFGFPTGAAVTGSKRVSFDITGFMDLLSLLNREGNCDFRLTVTDASGTVTKTIQLYVVK